MFVKPPRPTSPDPRDTTEVQTLPITTSTTTQTIRPTDLRNLLNLEFTTKAKTSLTLPVTLPKRNVKINLPPPMTPYDPSIKPTPEYDYALYENEVNLFKPTDFDASRFEPTQCKIPVSCCKPGGIGENYCGMNIIEPPYLNGCYEKTTMFFINSTAAIAGLWLMLWCLMMLQIIAARFTIRQIRLERKFAKQWLKAQNQWQSKISSSHDSYNQQHDNGGKMLYICYKNLRLSTSMWLQNLL